MTTKQNKSGSKKSPRPWRDAIESLVVAIIAALVIKQFALEAFQVPTESMEPTIIGRDAGGFRIIANKFVYQLREPRRWEVVVFQYPLNRLMNYVKRMVGIGDEWLFIRNGDVWTAPGNLDHDAALAAATIQRKPEAVQDRIFDRLDCIPPADRGIDAFRRYWEPAQVGTPADTVLADMTAAANRIKVDVDEGEVRFDGREAEAFVRFTRPPADRRYFDESRNEVALPSIRDQRFDDWSPRVPARNPLLLELGLPGPARGDGPRPWEAAAVGDVRLQLEVKPEGKKGAVVVEIMDGSHPRRIVVRLAVAGSEERSFLRIGEEETAIDATLPDGDWTEVEVANVDDRVTVKIDGDAVLVKDYVHAPVPIANPILAGTQTSPPSLTEDVRRRDEIYRAPHDNGVGFGFGGGLAAVRDVHLARDLFYRYAGATDFHIPPDHFLMLGDNSPNSLDCRAFERADLHYQDDDGKEIVISGDFQAVGAEMAHHEGGDSLERFINRPMINPYDGDTRFIDVFGNTWELDPGRIRRRQDPFHPDRTVAVETWFDHYVPREYVLGRAYVVFWPLLQIGVIR